MKRFTIGAGIALAACIGWTDSLYPKDPVVEAMKLAGKNRGELQRVLDHYKSEPLKLEAARFLIANMIGKGYKVVTFTDKKGKDTGFDALKHPNLDAAEKALDAIEKERGPITETGTWTRDLNVIKADFLIEQIDGAFKAWQTFPWAKGVRFDVFRDYVLPYRGGKEPLEAWRGELMAKYADLPTKMKNPTDSKEAAGLVGQDLNSWFGFWDLYYMHPTEQGFAEMKKSGKGRCGDISNLTTFALRSAGIPCAIDYTPYWADTGNNHAWPVTLDDKGQASDASIHKAGKIYRKTFANQPGNLCFDVRKGEVIPPWLDRPDYADVTDQYLATSDVTVFVPKGTAHAYLCVFNDGEWRPIQWAATDSGSATIKGMGRDILYLPASFGKNGIAAIGPGFVLTKNGSVSPITPVDGLPTKLALSAVNRGDETYRLNTGKNYELFVWVGSWRSVGKAKANGKPLVFDKVPSGGLYWLVEEGSRKEERPFTFEDGKQRFW